MIPPISSAITKEIVSDRFLTIFANSPICQLMEDAPTHPCTVESLFIVAANTSPQQYGHLTRTACVPRKLFAARAATSKRQPISNRVARVVFHSLKEVDLEVSANQIPHETILYAPQHLE
jgi:hypothetical protein